MDEYKKCPFKKIVRILKGEYRVNEKTIETEFAECDGFNCAAAITHCDCTGTRYFDGCQLMQKERN